MFLFPSNLFSSIAKQQLKHTEHFPSSLSAHKQLSKIAMPHVLQQMHYSPQSVRSTLQMRYEELMAKRSAKNASQNYLFKFRFENLCFGMKGESRIDSQTLRFLPFTIC